MIILCWNCRGAGNPKTVQVLRRWCRNYTPDMVFLSETMIASSEIEKLRYTLGFPNAFGVIANGNSGGLCLYWRENVNFCLESFSNHHVIGHVKSPQGTE